MSIAFLLAAGLVAGADKVFQVGQASDYANQTSEMVTVGAKPYDTPELQSQAFGKKLNLSRYGVLPVLVVIENKRQSTLDLRSLEISLVSADGHDHVAAVSPQDLYSLGTPHGARAPGSQQIPLPIPIPRKKNPLSAAQLTDRSFSAQMLPPGESASGFFYISTQVTKKSVDD